ncbi:3-hydroxyacyl-ACP dehydratase [Mucilaginibacter ginkgonis]|uniref:3-hydroxyacyl-ACP dehydratase n=1 Tax=Mucilaginibacter ginkgonis TaxID=2682091 RepID=A0A6I4I268_9SPHI|nr:3-hydroxyacyl-ACP dehydratase [Mucilaginibacter ginkgonis]QQL49327.1 3-hydroxyacyl-ACP dehydratase [Mucilaginibacter ginkgonis]
MFPQDATTLIPQQQPFVMVNGLVFADDKSAKTSFEIIGDNPMCINGIFQEGGLLENMAQTAAAYAGFIASQNNEPVKKGFIGAVNNFEVLRLPTQGDQLLTEVNVVDEVMGVTVVWGKVFCYSELIASAELKIFISD